MGQTARGTSGRRPCPTSDRRCWCPRPGGGALNGPAPAVLLAERAQGPARRASRSSGAAWAGCVLHVRGRYQTGRVVRQVGGDVAQLVRADRDALRDCAAARAERVRLQEAFVEGNGWDRIVEEMGAHG